MKLGNHLDFAQNEARNLVAHLNPSDPVGPVKGQIYFNNANNTLWYFDGAAWQSAKGGVPDATTTVKGIIQLAGDLAGTSAAPQIAAGVIVDADVNSGAAIAESKLSLATDAAVGTGSRRTLGAGALQAMPGNRTLDAITAPAADLNLNTKKIINLVDPVSNQDAATKIYVDQVAQGLDAKPSCRVAYATNITLSGAASAEGGTTPTNGDRVLVMGQTATAQNGIYVVNTGGAWSRANDANNWNEHVGAFVFVEQGSNADNGYVCTVDTGGTIDVTPITWVQFSGAGQIISGAGLTKTGNTLDVGGSASITVAADSISVANNGITNAMIADGAVALNTADVTGTLPVANGGTGQVSAKAARETGLSAAGHYTSATHGAGTTITITQATHSLRASRALIVQVQDEATGAVELPDIVVAASGDVTVTFSASQTANSKRVTIVG